MKLKGGYVAGSTEVLDGSQGVFGAEFFTTVPVQPRQLGEMACVLAQGTSVDDQSIPEWEYTNGFPEGEHFLANEDIARLN